LNPQSQAQQEHAGLFVRGVRGIDNQAYRHASKPARSQVPDVARENQRQQIGMQKCAGIPALYRPG
jgi:hypothetical protein